MLQTEKEIFYNEGEILVRRSSFGDLKSLSDNMSLENTEELWMSAHHTPRSALEVALNKSVMALTIEHEGKPVGIFGIMTDNLLGEKAEIYFLVTEDFEKIGRIFLRHCRKFIDMFLEFYPTLYNYAYCNNTKSIFWMKYCGARFEQPEVYGIEGRLFSLFFFTK